MSIDIKDDSEKLPYWRKLAILALIIFVVFCFRRDFVFYKSFQKCSVATEARIVGKFKRHNSRGSHRCPELAVNYMIEGEVFKDENTVTLSYYNSKNVGDTIMIRYACDYPDWSYFTEIEDQSLFRFLPKSLFR